MVSAESSQGLWAHRESGSGAAGRRACLVSPDALAVSASAALYSGDTRSGRVRVRSPSNPAGPETPIIFSRGAGRESLGFGGFCDTRVPL